MPKQKTRVFIAGEEQSRTGRYGDGEGRRRKGTSALGWLLRACRGRTVPILGTAAALGVAGAIVVNAVWMQAGPHPAPLLSRKPPAEAAKTPSDTTGTLAGGPRPRATEPKSAGEAGPPSPRPRPQTMEELQRELAAAERKPAPSPAPAVPTPRPRKIDTGGSASPARVTAVQRALAEYGYGQIKLSGVFDEPTRKAVEKFERERNLPVTGEFSPRLVRELAAVTGRPIN